MCLNYFPLQPCSPELFPQREHRWSHTAAWLPHLQPQALTCTHRALQWNFKVGIQAWCLPLKKKIDWLSVGQRLPWLPPPVSWKADSCSVAYSGFYNECVQCQLLCRVAPESRVSAEGAGPQEAGSGFRNGLSFTYFVFWLDSSEMVQLATCCSEGRSCAGDRDCNSDSQREEAVHLCPGQWVSSTPLDDAMSHKTNVYFSWRSPQKVMRV